MIRDPRVLRGEALNIIEDMMEEQIISTEDADLKTRAMVSSLQLPRGQVYESRDKEAVRTDLTCVEAMTSHQMLTLEERSLVQTQPRTELPKLLTYLYGGSLKKYSEVKFTSFPSASSGQRYSGTTWMCGSQSLSGSTTTATTTQPSDTASPSSRLTPTTLPFSWRSWWSWRRPVTCSNCLTASWA